MSTIIEIDSLSELSEPQARDIFAQGEEAVVFVLLALSKMVAEQKAAEGGCSHEAPATPSGMKPPYAKPPVSGRGKKRPGGQAGHAGSRRQPPARIHRRQSHRAEACPDCGGPLKRCAATRTRYIEDIPESEPEATEHTVHRDWCPSCGKAVEPAVPDALPGSTLGLRVLVLSAWLHYALGNTLSQIVDVFNFHLQMPLSAGGLMQMWYRLQAVLYAWYEQLQAEALQAARLQADETGWRVNGKTHWLWCFLTDDVTFYMIDRSRGSPALQKFFTEEFQGTLVSDFWGAYNAVACALRQTCLVHLLRELEQTEKYKSPGPNWPAFAKKLRRLLADSIRLWRRQDELTPDAYASKRARLGTRLQTLIDTDWDSRHAKRLIKRLRRHQHDLFTFLDEPDVPFHNNAAESAIRPAVILRKNSYGNRSQQGADCQAVLMSIFRTLKQRGHDPIRTVIHAVRQQITTGRLPELPKPKTTSSG